MIRNDYPDIKQCGVEQLVARRAHNPKVISSSLVPATKESMAVMLVAFNGPLVYRLGRQIFILEIGVRFPCGLLRGSKESPEDSETAFNLFKGGFPFYTVRRYSPKFDKENYLITGKNIIGSSSSGKDYWERGLLR